MACLPASYHRQTWFYHPLLSRMMALTGGKKTFSVARKSSRQTTSFTGRWSVQKKPIIVLQSRSRIVNLPPYQRHVRQPQRSATTYLPMLMDERCKTIFLSLCSPQLHPLFSHFPHPHVNKILHTTVSLFPVVW